MTELKISCGGIIKDAGSTKANKTGGWRTFKPVIDVKKCIKCMKCWMFCPDHCINIKNLRNSSSHMKNSSNFSYNKNIEVNLDYCKGCGICAERCPVKAIEMVKEKK